MTEIREEIITYPQPDLEVANRALKVLAIIVAEFTSDVTSVQCFDRRTVAEAEAIIEERMRLERRGDVPPLLTGGPPISTNTRDTD